MTLLVEWTKEAEITYSSIILAIGNRWSPREIENFIARTEQVIHLIQKNPLLYPNSKSVAIHRAVVARQTSLYYQVLNNKIVLLSFEDNRQNPDKTKH
jgi:plasmid stabilization system protein ParE